MSSKTAPTLVLVYPMSVYKSYVKKTKVGQVTLAKPR